MSQKRTLSPDQDAAANPLENVWVQANAGTGKTSVLIQRLLRILFRTDNLSHNGILCLTYTNAAAGEMRNRILSSLRQWATLPDTDLAEILNGVATNTPVTPSDIAHARQIFFTYIDNPDILKIKTIHGFCEEILRRFPIEAGISPAWTLISDDTRHILLQDAFHRLINSANDARVNSAFAHIVNRVSEYFMDDMLELLSSQYKDFFQITNRDNYRKYFIDTTRKFLNLDTPIQTEFSPQQLNKIIDFASQELNYAKPPAKQLTCIINLTKQYINNSIDFEEYKKLYLTSDGTPKKNLAKKAYLVAELNRVYAQDQRNIAQQIYDDTIAMFDLADAFAKIYRDLKHQKNLLDFEDLILYTKKLFSDPETMGWILSQLDIHLGHILVDEAQDTSPLQWDILQMLAGDFFTDGDTQNTPHSLFVVGDTKQSIYGFQGADPRAFATSRDAIASQIKQNLRTIREIPLAQSFRSLPPILHAVDAVFNDDTVIKISDFSNNNHTSFRRDTGGLVEIHKLMSQQSDNIPLTDFLKTIVEKITTMVKTGCAPSDIMILVQKRHPMVPILVKELKRNEIPVAGSDRIILPQFPAIRDLLNLVRFCINTSDDYSLCCVLKSPIFRLNERDIFNICTVKNNANRTQNHNQTPISIFDILHDIAPDIHSRLTRYIGWCEKMSPYTFFSNVLNTDNVRQSMIAALGNQIIDPLEEFMTICLAYERTQPGTMRHFIKWFITSNSEIKRDMDASAGVRIVTIHGSKGLESPIVFLIDTVRVPSSEKIVPIPCRKKTDMPTPWLWVPHSDNNAQRADAAAALNKIKISEYYRLLYVAMTRARDQLYIYGYTPYKNAPENAWHTQLWRILANNQTTENIRTSYDQ